MIIGWKNKAAKRLWGKKKRLNKARRVTKTYVWRLESLEIYGNFSVDECIFLVEVIVSFWVIIISMSLALVSCMYKYIYIYTHMRQLIGQMSKLL